ncbi:MAG: hypothetical protein LAQ30_20835, partial [Acidobacteriia bacterium]|nr:hypothetical protein [Terriglobia bacterium]
MIESPRGNGRAYAWLTLLFAATLASQAPFTMDVVRVLARDYPLREFYVGAPWPSLVTVSEKAKAAGLREGDRVLALDGAAPRGLQDTAAPFRRKPGAAVTVTVERGGRP